jgi:hypothetical protein
VVDHRRRGVSLLALVTIALSGIILTPNALGRASLTSVPAFNTTAIHLVDLPLGRRYYVRTPIASLVAPWPVDRVGVPLFRRDGKSYYHPVVLAARALDLLDGYRRTHDRRYLDGARRVANRLVAMSSMAGGARYLPYGFDFALHGRASETLHAPWYSGMAEGMALSVFSRLHAIEGRASDLDVARSLFLALEPHGRTGAWVTWVDTAGYVWIEEYPGAHPDHTLNGFNFALFGLYDYIEETGDQDATHLFIGGLTTVIHYLPQFRQPGHISLYCLAHRVQSQKYHDIHVAQLKMLARMTESPLLARYAALFDADA